MKKLSSNSFKVSVAPENGADATTYWLVPSTTQVKRKADGTHLPEYVSCESMARTGDDTPVSGIGTVKFVLTYKSGSVSTEFIYASRIIVTADMAGIAFRLYVGGQVLDEKTVVIVDDGQQGKPGESVRGRMPFPSGIWDVSATYTATDSIAPIVYYEAGKTYYVMNKSVSVTGLNPVEDYAVNGSDATWIPFENYKAIFTEIIMANFAKMASAVFFGDYMFSQYGKDASSKESTNYGLFDPAKIGQSNCPFTPNLMMDLLKGEFRLGDKFVASIKNGKLDIVMQGKLQTSATGERIVIDPDDKSITLYDSNGLKSIELFIGHNGNGVVRSYSRDYNNGVRQTATLSDGQLVIDDGVQSVYPSIENNSFAIFSNGFRLNNHIEQRFDVFNTVSHDGSNKRIVEVLSSAWPTSASQVLPGGVYIENYFLKVRPGW